MVVKCLYCQIWYEWGGAPTGRRRSACSSGTTLWWRARRSLLEDLISSKGRVEENKTLRDRKSDLRSRLFRLFDLGAPWIAADWCLRQTDEESAVIDLCLTFPPSATRAGNETQEKAKDKSNTYRLHLLNQNQDLWRQTGDKKLSGLSLFKVSETNKQTDVSLFPPMLQGTHLWAEREAQKPAGQTDLLTSTNKKLWERINMMEDLHEGTLSCFLQQVQMRTAAFWNLERKSWMN